MLPAGRLRALGMGETKRSAAAPEIPTIAEEGVPGFGRSGGFIGLFAPAGTPPAVVKKISAEVAEILKTPAVQANVQDIDRHRRTTRTTSPSPAILAAESAHWKVVLKDLFK